MVSLVIVAAVVASYFAVEAEGSVSKAEAVLFLRKRANTVTTKRNLASCSGTSDWACTDTTTCRKIAEDSAGYECMQPTTEGSYCEDSEHCASPLRCHENSCQSIGMAGGACTVESASVAYIERYPLRQCQGGYCPKGFTTTNLCLIYTPKGGECTSNSECDSKYQHCNTENGAKTCTEYVKNGGTCQSDEQCGGSNPPQAFGFCDAAAGECKDLGEEVEGFFQKLLGVFVAIIVGVVAICVCLCYCACCKKKSVVVVQQA